VLVPNVGSAVAGVGVTAPLWVGLLVGIAFGIPASLWGIGNPETVIRTGRLVDRLLIGCFASVTAFGAVLLYGLHAVGLPMHFDPKPLYVYSGAIGGVNFGIGAAIGGYFPGTEWIALGEGRRDALYAIPGGLMGAAAWTLIYQTTVGQLLVSSANVGEMVVTGHVADTRPWTMLAVAVGYAAVVLTLLYFLPRYKGGAHSCRRHLGTGCVDDHDRAFIRDTTAFLTEGAVDVAQRRVRRLQQWVNAEAVPFTNYYARTILGVASTVALIVVGSILLRQVFGQSTTYSWLIGTLLLQNFDYTAVVVHGIGWEPLSDVGVMVGAMITSVFISGRFTAFRPVVPPSWRNRFGTSPIRRGFAAFTGSFLVLFGARMAGGCTSGHTLSGGVQLSLSAWVFTAAVVLSMVFTARLVYRDTTWLTVPPQGTGAPEAIPGGGR